MKNNINICIVAGTHGDEYNLGARVQELVEQVLPGRGYMLTGNPRAVEASKRFIDSDLNRSFDGSGTGYEAERVGEIDDICKSEGFTHVIDIHTSPTTHSIVPILPVQCVGPEADQLVNVTPSITSIVELPKDDMPYSLVASFGLGGIALECPRYGESEISGRIARGVLAMMLGHEYPAQIRDIYLADGLIPLEADIPNHGLDDFKEIPMVGGQAFVADPQTYQRLGYGHQGMTVTRLQERSI